MKKTKKINKLGLVLTLVLVIALALVVSAGATTFVISNLDGVSGEGVFANGSYGLVNYGNVANGNFAFASLVGDYNYTFVIFDIEAFKTRYNGYTVQQVEEEIFLEMQLSQNSGLQTMYYSFFYDYSYYGFESSEEMLNYAMSWQPSISQDVYNELQTDYNTLQGEFNTLQGDYTRLGAMLDNAVVQYEQLQGNYNTLQGEFNTLQGNYNALENSIPNIEANAKSEGYNEGYNVGMTDADAVERGIMSIVGAPMYILTSVFDVEIFGINLLGLITTIMTIIIVAWVIKKLAN